MLHHFKTAPYQLLVYLLVKMRNPLGELSRVGDRGREEDVVNVVRQQNDRLLPDDSSFLVPHVVDLVEDDPTNLASDF